NGTHVNGQRVDTAELADGDKIKAGHTVLLVTMLSNSRQDSVSRTPPPLPAHVLRSQPETIPTGKLLSAPPPLPTPVDTNPTSPTLICERLPDFGGLAIPRYQPIRML